MSQILGAGGGGGISTPVTVPDGGTGLVTITDHAVMVGSGVAAVTPVGPGISNTVLLGNTGADPSFGQVPNAALANSSVTLSNGNNITITGSPVSLGGTATVNVSGTTQYAVQVGDATGSLDSLAVGTASQILQSGGAGANPAWSTATYPATTTQGDVLYSSADNTVASLAKDATATRYVANTGAGNNPAWDQVNLANGVTGTLPVGNGGTGAATLTDHGVLVGSGVGAVTALAVGTDGQVLLGSTGADPVFATLTSTGGTIAFTPGAGSLNLEASGGGGGGLTREDATGATQAMAVDTEYTTNRPAGIVAYTLPATAAVGEVIQVVGNSSSGWSIAQNAGQTIHILGSDTTTGVGGSLASTTRYDCVTLKCTVADTDFVVSSMMGNLTVT